MSVRKDWLEACLGDGLSWCCDCLINRVLWTIGMNGGSEVKGLGTRRNMGFFSRGTADPRQDACLVVH